MANAEHLAILKKGVEVWNKWREENSTVKVDLTEADLNGMNLNGVDFKWADLFLASLKAASLQAANFSGCSLIEADLSGANLSGAVFSGANLLRANCVRTNLDGANFYNANLSNANLFNSSVVGARFERTILIQTNLSNANIVNTIVYGVASWDIKKEGTIQKDLIITRKDQAKITVDDIEIAQFIYLLLNNQKFRDVIETVTSKAVLILGRFTDERIKVLDAIRDELRNRNFLPILFDFEKPVTRDLTETISILAKLSRFVIADLTDAKSIPQELSHVIPFMPHLPVIPIIFQGQREYAMFEHWRPYPWVLPIYEYENGEHLIATLSAGVIEPAEKKVQEIRGK